MSDPQKASVAQTGAEQTQERSLLDQIVEEGRLARDPAGRERGKNLVQDQTTRVGAAVEAGREAYQANAKPTEPTA